MKVGDLVTLSSYALKKSDLWLWKNELERGKPLIGLVIRAEENPYTRPWTSKNESVFYYINWVQNGPASRWGNQSYYNKHQGYFLRNDLKFVK